MSQPFGTAYLVDADDIWPEQILPAQFYSSASSTPERRLFLAVLLDGINAARGMVLGLSRNARRRAIAEARQWIRSDSMAYPLSFCSLCALFELEPEAVRASLTGATGGSIRTKPAVLRGTPRRKAA